MASELEMQEAEDYIDRLHEKVDTLNAENTRLTKELGEFRLLAMANGQDAADEAERAAKAERAGGAVEEMMAAYMKAVVAAFTTKTAAPEERQSSERTCATCHAVLADGPQPFATYAPDTRPAEQAVTEAIAEQIDREWRAKGGLNCTEVCAIVRSAALAQEKGR